MNLDRREKHVINELKTVHKVKLRHFAGLVNSKQLSIRYVPIDDFGMVYCVLEDDNQDNTVVGKAYCSPKDKYSQPIGRMISLADAIVLYVKHPYALTGTDFENIARGKSI